MKIKKFFGLGVIFASFLLGSCSNETLFARSNAFYINDQAEALLSSTKYLIYHYSSELYEKDSRNEQYKTQKIDGAQIVVATHIGEPSSINTTEIFNNWGIGENDMGLLLMLHFAPNPQDKYSPTYIGMTREIGKKLSGYLSMFRLEEIFINTWENPMFDTVHIKDHDYKLAFFYIAILEEIYTKIYTHVDFDSEALMDSYDRNQYNLYTDLIPQGYRNEVFFDWWVWLLIALGGLSLLGSGGFWMMFVSSGKSFKSGGGGKSGGYKYTR